MERVLEYLSMGLGVIAVIYPISTALYFVNTNKIGNASAWMFIGEGLGMAVTTAFAWLAFTGHLNDLSGVTQSLMRIFMFCVAIYTSSRLHLVLREITEDNGNLYSYVKNTAARFWRLLWNR